MDGWVDGWIPFHIGSKKGQKFKVVVEFENIMEALYACSGQISCQKDEEHQKKNHETKPSPITTCHFFKLSICSLLSYAQSCIMMLCLNFCLLFLRGLLLLIIWHNSDDKLSTTPYKSITLSVPMQWRWVKTPWSQQGRNDKHHGAEFWTDALFISQEPWAVRLSMPGASPTECNLLYNKMYELPNFPQQAWQSASLRLKSTPLLNLCFALTIWRFKIQERLWPVSQRQSI